MKKDSFTKNSAVTDHDNTPQNERKVKKVRVALLGWYDKHRRVLPWRALPSQTPDPYHVWLSEIMLQQTVVNAVIPYFQKFVEKWPTIQLLAKTEQNEIMEAWAGLGYYSRARNLLKCANIITNQYNGHFPETQKELKGLPGIGDYTSAAIMAIAFNKSATVVDGNVERVITRLYAVHEPLPDSKKQIKSLAAEFFENFQERPGDLAQAMMDLGATICIPKAPRCVLCPLQNDCSAHIAGIEEQLPSKVKKKQKPQKHGYIYAVKNDKGEILLQRRPEKGMLGGMLGFPTSDWILNSKEKRHAAFIDDLSESTQIIHNRTAIKHSFTHFDLELTSCSINGQKMLLNDDNEFFWFNEKQIIKENFPTVFRKFIPFIV